MRFARIFTLALAPLAATACASLARQSAIATPQAIIEVENSNSSDVTVYLQRSSYEHRLGVVPANGRSTLTIPRHLVPASGTIRLLGDPDGAGQAFLMRPFQLDGERLVRFEIGKDARNSRLTVWSPGGRVAPSSVAVH